MKDTGKTTLVVGGTSGIGFELACQFRARGDRVIVTGRSEPQATQLEFIELELDESEYILGAHLLDFVAQLPPIDNFVYAAGFLQRGTIDELSRLQIRKMMNVGGYAPMVLLGGLLRKQPGHLDGFMAITSTSANTPRWEEPVYNFVKAGLSHFTMAQATTGQIRQVMEGVPSGVDSAFWDEIPDKDRSMLMSPARCAELLMAAWNRHEPYLRVRTNRLTNNSTDLAGVADIPADLMRCALASVN